MSIQRSVTPEGAHVLRIQGKLVASSVDELRDALVAIGDGARVVINLKGVHLVDSIAIGALVRRHGMLRDQGGDLVLCCPHPSVERLLQMADLDKHFEVFHGEELALQALKDRPVPPPAPRKRGRKPKGPAIA